MERIWLKSYPKGVPAEINPGEYRSLVDLFERSIRAYGDRPAFHCMGKSITFAELDRMARDFGAWLQARGVAKGARVALMMPNCLQYPIAMFGTLRAGWLVVNLVVRKVKKMVPPYSLPGAVTFKQALAEGASAKLVTPPLGHDDIAF